MYTPISGPQSIVVCYECLPVSAVKPLVRDNPIMWASLCRGCLLHKSFGDQLRWSVRTHSMFWITLTFWPEFLLPVWG